MSASSFPPDTSGSPVPASALLWFWNWMWPAISSIFGAGVMWGITRTSTNDHARRLTRLEETVPEALRDISDKIDDNHRETMRLIFSMAQQRKL